MSKLSFCFFLVLIFFSSCNNDIDPVRDNPSKVVCHQSVEEAFKNFEMVLSNNLRAFQFMADNPGVLRLNPYTRALDTMVEDEYTGDIYDLGVFLEPAEDLIAAMGFTENDLRQMTSDMSIHSTSDLSDVEKINLALLSWATKEDIINGSGSYFVNVGHELNREKAYSLIGKQIPPLTYGGDTIMTRGSISPWMAANCLVDAMGLNGIVKNGIIKLIKDNNLKKLRDLVVKIAVRLGFKTLSGVGAALVVAEVAYCMYDKSNNALMYSDFGQVPDWWTPTCGYTKKEAAELPIVLYNHSMIAIYSMASRANQGIVPNVYRITKEDVDVNFFH